MDKIIREHTPTINYYNDAITYDVNNNFNISENTIFELIPDF
jgi:hypothetical protein